MKYILGKQNIITFFNILKKTPTSSVLYLERANRNLPVF
ncbi:hypothetical protein LEP1GSC081_3884 [Leptospira kirschneri str. H1]|uniref:Uncharacterized protein n=1 Tax=Leptospira kirschneri str. H1 TaxID=1049966 RepID=A0A0E2BG81_9LEPT|nr:hypothetical protein LEP1GSC081_3884 [Leptospira kirschneri str. H1]